MKNNYIHMSEQTYQRAQVCERINASIISRAEGARQLDTSYRTMLRILKRYTTSGIGALVHKAVDRPSNHHYPEKVKRRILTMPM